MYRNRKMPPGIASYPSNFYYPPRSMSSGGSLQGTKTVAMSSTYGGGLLVGGARRKKTTTMTSKEGVKCCLNAARVEQLRKIVIGLKKYYLSKASNRAANSLRLTKKVGNKVRQKNKKELIRSILSKYKKGDTTVDKFIVSQLRKLRW